MNVTSTTLKRCDTIQEVLETIQAILLDQHSEHTFSSPSLHYCHSVYQCELALQLLAQVTPIYISYPYPDLQLLQQVKAMESCAQKHHLHLQIPLHVTHHINWGIYKHSFIVTIFNSWNSLPNSPMEISSPDGL